MQKNQLILSIHCLKIQQIPEIHNQKATPTATQKQVTAWLEPSKVSECFASQWNIKAAAILFVNVLLEFNKLPFLDTSDMSDYFHQKSITYIENRELHSWFLFRDIVKTLQTCYFKYFENADNFHHHALHVFTIMPITL